MQGILTSGKPFQDSDVAGVQAEGKEEVRVCSVGVPRQAAGGGGERHTLLSKTTAVQGELTFGNPFPGDGGIRTSVSFL